MRILLPVSTCIFLKYFHFRVKTKKRKVFFLLKINSYSIFLFDDIIFLGYKSIHEYLNIC